MSKIIGQDKLIKEVNRIFQVFVNSNCKIRLHFILTGESGSGKSFTIKQLCDMNELSFLEVNAAQITKEGISGNSLSKILSPLVNYSHTPIVVFVDEFDKLFINGKLIVAFDFDNTIFDYHNTGGDYSCVIELLKECSLLGFEMILFTTDEDDYKIMAKQTICMRLGIANITSNTLSAPNISSSIFSKSKKPYYNILLDDRAGLEESYEILKYVVDEIKLNQQGNQ